MEILNNCNKELNQSNFDTKSVMKNLDSIVNGIKDLQQRKFVKIFLYTLIEG